MLGDNRWETIRFFVQNLFEVVNRYAYSDFVTPLYARFRDGMMKIAPPGLNHVFFANSGAEANENAIKAAMLLRPGATTVIAFEGSFHGRTLGALSATYKKMARTGFQTFDWPFAPYPAMDAKLTDDQLFQKEMASLDFITKTAGEDPSKIIAVIIEPYQGEGGMRFATPRFYRNLRSLTANLGIPLIIDEVQSGMGLTGKNWAHERFELPLPPDMVTFAKKAQTGGVYFNERSFIREGGKLNSTWGGSEGGIVRTVSNLAVAERESLFERVARLGILPKTKLADFQTTINNELGEGLVSHVRGEGWPWRSMCPAAPSDFVVDKALREDWS